MKKIEIFYRMMLPINMVLVLICAFLVISNEHLASCYIDLASQTGKLYALEYQNNAACRTFLEKQVKDSEGSGFMVLVLNKSVIEQYNKAVLAAFDKNIKYIKSRMNSDVKTEFP